MASLEFILEAILIVACAEVCVYLGCRAGVALYDWAQDRQFPQDEPPDDLTPGAA